MPVVQVFADTVTTPGATAHAQGEIERIVETAAVTEGVCLVNEHAHYVEFFGEPYRLRRVTGMNAAEVETMLGMIRSLREKKGITCIVIEHNLKAVMGLCDRIAVLNFGLKIAEGIPEEIVRNPAVMEAYLGTEEDVF